STVGEAGGEVDADTDRRIRAASGGSAMAPHVERAMGDAFGTDFANVKVHVGAESRALNQRINAKAFTAGNNIWFRDGMPDTSSSAGQHLLAHELTHVVQQGGAGKVSRTTIRRKGGKDDLPTDLPALNLRSAGLRK